MEVQQTIVTGPVEKVADGFRIPFRAFKFDGSSSVRITCAVDMCNGPCNPVGRVVMLQRFCRVYICG